MRRIKFGRYAPGCAIGAKGLGSRALAALALVGCLDELKDPHPVVQLRAPDGPIVVEAGHSFEVAVQALDVQEQGVNGAHIAFARVDAARLSFDEGELPDVDAVTVVTSTGLLAGVSAEGVGQVRILASNAAAPGATSVLAVVRMPTADDDSAVSLRIGITIAEPAAPEADSGAGGTSGAEPTPGSGGTAS